MIRNLVFDFYNHIKEDRFFLCLYVELSCLFIIKLEFVCLFQRW
jgi:hypothetical protein